MFKKLANWPASTRAVPFVVFVALTWLQGKLGDTTPYSLYLTKTLIGACLIWVIREAVAEMRWEWSWEATVTGVGVFVLWVGLEGHYPVIFKPDTEWNPNKHFGEGLAWFYVVVRMVGSTFVVPPLEEVFYRSFVYRFVVREDFLTIPLGRFAWMPFLATSLVFGFVHREWLPGILCGMCYQGLVCWKQRLGDAMTAHAITNFLLGIWVVWKGAWQFW